eukprot:TRINITY_DN2946_c0_g1_i3.p1 TRINITY_DN2946_c0_g1~~TRINITY_DN2946_c0_g1_i3.p1  ORF type:complete len:507 (-),score=138.27 TRINITY_DN2946_c0_g1_i3:66-1586(-)
MINALQKGIQKGVTLLETLDQRTAAELDQRFKSTAADPASTTGTQEPVVETHPEHESVVGELDTLLEAPTPAKRSPTAGSAPRSLVRKPAGAVATESGLLESLQAAADTSNVMLPLESARAAPPPPSSVIEDSEFEGWTVEDVDPEQPAAHEPAAASAGIAVAGEIKDAEVGSSDTAPQHSELPNPAPSVQSEPVAPTTEPIPTPASAPDPHLLAENRELRLAKTMLESQQKALTSEVSALTAKHQAVQSKLQTAAKEITSLKGRLKEREAQLGQIRQTESEFQAVLQQKDAHATMLQTKLKEAIQAITARNSTIAELEQDRDALLGQMEQLRTDLEKAQQSQSESLSARAKEDEEERRAHERNLARVQERSLQLEEELSQLRSSVAATEKQLETYRVDLARAQSRAKTAEEDKKRISESAAEYKASAIKRFLEQEKELEALRGSTVAPPAAPSTAELENLLSQLEAMRTQRDEAHLEVQRLKAELQQAEADLLQAQGEHETTQEV